MNGLSVLEQLGLTKPERDAYLGLVELGESKTGNLCSHTGIRSSKIYMVLDMLIEKGLVTYTTKNNVKHYSATSADALELLFTEKQQQIEQQHAALDKLISSIKESATQQTNASKYKYFEGIRGIKALYLELLKHMDVQTTSRLHIYSANTQMTNRLLGFFEEFHTERVQKGISYRLIVPEGLRSIVNKRKEQLAEIHTKNISSAVSWGTFGEYFFVNFNGGSNPYGILVQDKLTAQTFEMVFADLWSQSESA